MRYYLLVYQRSAGRLLSLTECTDRLTAQERRFELEHQHRTDPDIEVVVLGAESLEAVKRTHARYFFTLPELFAQMRDAARSRA